MIRTLTEHGYLRVEQVAEPGEFAVRGAVLDVFPTGSELPVRIDLFDDEIESLRTFDPQTQLSAGKRTRVESCPRASFRSTKRHQGLSASASASFPGRPGRCPIYRTISEAQLPAGIEYYLPLFFDDDARCSITCRADALLVSAEDALAGLDETFALIEERFEQLRGDIERADPDARGSLLRAGRICARVSTSRLTLHARRARVAGDRHGCRRTPASRTRSRSGVAASDDRIARWIGAGSERTLLATSSPGHREMMLELLRNRGYEPRHVAGWRDFVAGDAPLGVAVAELGEGFRIAARSLRVVTSTELGMERPQQRQRRRAHATPKRSSASSPISRSARRSCTRTTASAAIRD